MHTEQEAFSERRSQLLLMYKKTIYSGRARDSYRPYFWGRPLLPSAALGPLSALHKATRGPSLTML